MCSIHLPTVSLGRPTGSVGGRRAQAQLRSGPWMHPKENVKGGEHKRNGDLDHGCAPRKVFWEEPGSLGGSRALTRGDQYPQAKGMRHSLRNPMYILSDICRILMSGGIRIPPVRSAVYSETVTVHPQDGSENIIIPAIPLGTPRIYQVIYAGF